MRTIKSCIFQLASQQFLIFREKDNIEKENKSEPGNTIEMAPKKDKFVEKMNKSERGHRLEFLLNTFTLSCNGSQIEEEEAKLIKNWEVSEL